MDPSPYSLRSPVDQLLDSKDTVGIIAKGVNMCSGPESTYSRYTITEGMRAVPFIPNVAPKLFGYILMPSFFFVNERFENHSDNTLSIETTI